MEPASIRYKNPGAMWGSPLAIKWGAQKKAVVLKDGKGQGNNIAVFPTYVAGICAQLDLWRSSRLYKNKKFCDAIATWSGGNEVKSYIDFVLKRVPGMTRNTIMNDDFWSSSSGIGFLKAQAWHEAGKKYPAPDKDWIEAQRRVFEGVTAAPHNTESVSIEIVQQRLDDFGYHEVGTIDGKWGGKTAGAIAAFSNDRHLVGSEGITPQLIKEMDKAKAEGWKRSIAPARALATVAELKEEAPEIIPAEQNKTGGIVVAGASVTGTAVSLLGGSFKESLTWLDSVKGFFDGVPGYAWFGIATVISMGFAWNAWRGSKQIATAYKTGERN